METSGGFLIFVLGRWFWWRASTCRTCRCARATSRCWSRAARRWPCPRRASASSRAPPTSSPPSTTWTWSSPASIPSQLSNTVIFCTFVVPPLFLVRRRVLRWRSVDVPQTHAHSEPGLARDMNDVILSQSVNMFGKSNPFKTRSPWTWMGSRYEWRHSKPIAVVAWRGPVERLPSRRCSGPAAMATMNYEPTMMESLMCRCRKSIWKKNITVTSRKTKSCIAGTHTVAIVTHSSHNQKCVFFDQF